MVPDLLKVVKEDKDEKRRRTAVLALGFLGPPARAAVADLEAKAKKLAVKKEPSRDDEWLAKALEMALGRIRDPKAIPVEKMRPGADNGEEACSGDIAFPDCIADCRIGPRRVS